MKINYLQSKRKATDAMNASGFFAGEPTKDLNLGPLDSGLCSFTRLV